MCTGCLGIQRLKENDNHYGQRLTLSGHRPFPLGGTVNGFIHRDYCSYPFKPDVSQVFSTFGNRFSQPEI